MASWFCSVAFVLIINSVCLVSPPDLLCMNAQVQTAKDRKAEADRLLNLGIQKYNVSHFEAAMQIWQQALTIYREIKDRLGESKALGHLGIAYGDLGKYDKAIEYELQSLVIAQETKDRLGESNALGHLGIAYGDLSKYDKAIDYELQWLAIAREIKDRLGEGHALGNLGIAYKNLGKYDKAIDYELQWLVIAQETKDRLGEGHALGNLGIAYKNLGKYDKAIDYELQSLAIKREIKDRLGEGHALGNLGIDYLSLGKYNKAIDYELQWLAIAREIKDRHSEGRSLGYLGIAYGDLGQYDKAIDYELQWLAIAREIKDRLGEGAALGYLGIAYQNLGQYDKAINYELQWLAIAREIGDRQSEGKALGYLGLPYDYLGQYDKAIEYELQWLAIAREIGDRNSEGIALNTLGATLAKLKQPELAILYYKQAIKVRESIRKDIKILDKDLQKSYLETVSASYHRLADLLLQQGRIIEALQVLDLLKVQELDDYLKNVKGNDRTFQGIRLLDPEKAFSDKLFAINFEKVPELNRQLTDQIQQLPKSEIDKPPEYLQNLPQGTALIYPLILSDRLEIIIFSANSPAIHRTVNIKKDELEQIILDFRSDLQDISSLDVKDSSTKLYNVLFKPIEEDLKQTKANTILYAPDGFLRYIPLAALCDGKQWLVEKYRINNLIAYSLFDQNSKPQTNPSIFAGAFGNSDKGRSLNFARLPATIREVNSIKSIFPNTTEITEQKFTAEVSKNKAVGNAIIHLATHAQFQSGSPLDSYVLFGDGSKATISDISNWNLKNVDLVVLSACQTGVGTLQNGAEILGFGYQVQKAGAKASISSLWEVSDGGTQLLMQAFYENLKKGNPSLSSSLREAQLSMIYRPVKQGELEFSHPYYWSAFVLIGNGV